MRVDAIILADSEFISAFLLKLKIHKAEIDNFVTFFVYVLLLCKKNLKIAIEIIHVKNKKIKFLSRYYNINGFSTRYTYTKLG